MLVNYSEDNRALALERDCLSKVHKGTMYWVLAQRHQNCYYHTGEHNQTKDNAFKGNCLNGLVNNFLNT